MEADIFLIMSHKVIKNEISVDESIFPRQVDPQMWRAGFLYMKLLHVFQIILDITGLHDKMVSI